MERTTIGFARQKDDIHKYVVRASCEYFHKKVSDRTRIGGMARVKSREEFTNYFCLSGCDKMDHCKNRKWSWTSHLLSWSASKIKLWQSMLTVSWHYGDKAGESHMSKCDVPYGGRMCEALRITGTRLWLRSLLDHDIDMEQELTCYSTY